MDINITTPQRFTPQIQKDYNTKSYKRKEFVDLFYQYNEWVQNYKKLGRNDICTCGSGKKYKKCCGVKHQNGEFKKFEKLSRYGYNINKLTEEDIVNYFNVYGVKEVGTNDFGQKIETIKILF